MLGATSAASAVSMKEEIFVDAVETAAFLALYDEVLTAMKKQLEEIAPVCIIYDYYFRNVVEEHELGAREDI